MVDLSPTKYLQCLFAETITTLPGGTLRGSVTVKRPDRDIVYHVDLQCVRSSRPFSAWTSSRKNKRRTSIEVHTHEHEPARFKPRIQRLPTNEWQHKRAANLPSRFGDGVHAGSFEFRGSKEVRVREQGDRLFSRDSMENPAVTCPLGNISPQPFQTAFTRGDEQSAARGLFIDRPRTR